MFWFECLPTIVMVSTSRAAAAVAGAAILTIFGFACVSADSAVLDDDEIEELLSGLHWTEPLVTTVDEQVAYSKRQEQEVYRNAKDEQFEAYGGKDANRIQITQIARPQGATSGFYTGVTHFRHINDPNLVTFLFSAGRHDGGTNTYLTIDTTEERPFEGGQEQFIEEANIAPWTWVSSYTKESDGGAVKHYTLFSGGSGREDGPSTLYIIAENQDGTLQEPVKDWVEPIDINHKSARFCLIEDLGNIYDKDGSLLSTDGNPDLIITGTGGLDIYSLKSMEEGFVRSRHVGIEDLGTDASALFGDQVVDKQYLVIASRARWREKGKEFTAPSIVYDYLNDIVVEEFAHHGQSVSVALVDNRSRVLVGSGGNTASSGQPNIMYDIIYEPTNKDGDNNDAARARYDDDYAYTTEADAVALKAVPAGKIRPTMFQLRAARKMSSKAQSTMQLVRSEMQLTEDMPIEFNYPFEHSDGTPDAGLPVQGHTKTRQVLSFQVQGVDADLVLEVNTAQTSNIYYRSDADSYTSKILQLPGSEGFEIFNANATRRKDRFVLVSARAGDALEIDGKLHVVIANFNGNNTVFSFDTDILST